MVRSFLTAAEPLRPNYKDERGGMQVSRTPREALSRRRDAFRQRDQPKPLEHLEIAEEGWQTWSAGFEFDAPREVGEGRLTVRPEESQVGRGPRKLG